MQVLLVRDLATVKGTSVLIIRKGKVLFFSILAQDYKPAVTNLLLETFRLYLRDTIVAIL